VQGGGTGCEAVLFEGGAGVLAVRQVSRGARLTTAETLALPLEGAGTVINAASMAFFSRGSSAQVTHKPLTKGKIVVGAETLQPRSVGEAVSLHPA